MPFHLRILSDIINVAASFQITLACLFGICLRVVIVCHVSYVCLGTSVRNVIHRFNISTEGSHSWRLCCVRVVGAFIGKGRGLLPT